MRRPGYLRTLGENISFPAEADEVKLKAAKLNLTCSGGSLIKVNSATYGGNCKSSNAGNRTSLFENCNNQASCDVNPQDIVKNDPAYMCKKDFTVDWTCTPKVGVPAGQPMQQAATEAWGTPQSGQAATGATALPLQMTPTASQIAPMATGADPGFPPPIPASGSSPLLMMAIAGVIGLVVVGLLVILKKKKSKGPSRRTEDLEAEIRALRGDSGGSKRRKR